ncbi:MAG: response regulator transcription factor [Phycisphaeraceae bacterium]|nr:response regulator transcription factor [Phycisphaeraceae bacterium]
MVQQDSATPRCVRAGVRAAEAIAGLPAVPTQDWSDRAARVLLSADRASVVLLMLGRLNEDGSLARIESVGVAGSLIAEVATNVGRLQSSSGPVAMDSTLPGLVALRTTAYTMPSLGWSPLSLLDGPSHSAMASRLAPEGSPASVMLTTRWSGAAGIGAVDLVLGAVRLGSPAHRRVAMVEMALAAQSTHTAAHEAAIVIDGVLPSLARRAEMAFDPSGSLTEQHLTTREEVVLERLLHGKSVRQIAEELERSPHTVHDHVKSLHRKLHAATRGALVARALGHIGPDDMNGNGNGNGKKAHAENSMQTNGR